MPDDAPAFAITAAKEEYNGVLRVAASPLAGSEAQGGDFALQRKWLYLRKEYLLGHEGDDAPPFVAALFAKGHKAFPILINEEEAMSLFFAARAFEAERAAQRYLSRAEHSRFQLELKLSKKGFSAKEAAPALDFLQREKALDDRRFALAWLNTRASLHPEGKAALCRALSERGVLREDADAALAAFFAAHDEEELCRAAAQKLIRRGRTGNKLVSSLLSRGFPFGMALRIAGES